MFDPRSSAWGLPQTRKRVYILMAKTEMMDLGELRSLAHIICEVLPESIPQRETIESCMNYVRHVRDVLGCELHEVSAAREALARIFVRPRLRDSRKHTGL